MAIKPIDIYNKEFDKTRKGYNVEQVDIFLDEIVESFENMYKMYVESKEKNEVLEEKLNNYRSIETALNKTLNTAELTAKDIIDNAQNKSNLLVQEAEIKAKKIVQTAEERASQIINESKEKTVDARREMEELKRQADIYKKRMISLLESQMKTIMSDYESVFDYPTQRTEEFAVEATKDIETTEEKEVDWIEPSNQDENEIPPMVENEAIENEPTSQIDLNESFSSLSIDHDYFNFQEENDETSVGDFTLPKEKHLDGTYQSIETTETEPLMDEEKTETKMDDYIQIDFDNPENLKIEQAEEKEDVANKSSEEQGYSLEDAFLELRRAAEIYKDSQDESLS